MWYTATSASVSSGSTIVQILSGDDISLVQEDGGLIFEGNSPVQIKRGYTDGSGNKFIELQTPWPYTDRASQPLVAYPTDASFSSATAEIRRVIDTLSVASITEMQQGVNNEKVATPLGVKASIAFNTGTAATKNATTKPADSTIGHLLKVGDKGTGQLTDVYGRSNILGAVSQLAGTPTGAIIESGSNVNGSYTKFADGTFFFYRSLPFDSYNGSQDYVFDLPVFSIERPIIVPSFRQSGSIYVDVKDGNIQTDITTKYIISFSSSSGVNGTANVFGIGRWY